MHSAMQHVEKMGLVPIWFGLPLGIASCEDTPIEADVNSIVCGLRASCDTYSVDGAGVLPQFGHQAP